MTSDEAIKRGVQAWFQTETPADDGASAFLASMRANGFVVVPKPHAVDGRNGVISLEYKMTDENIAMSREVVAAMLAAAQENDDGR